MSQVAAYFFTLYALAGDRFQDRKDRGATAVEYGLMVGLIAVVIIAVVLLLGGQLQDVFTGLTNELGTVEGVRDGAQAPA